MPGRLMLVALCGAVAAGCGGMLSPSRYTSVPGKFSANLPGTPKETELSVPTAAGPIAAHSFVSEDWKRVAYGVIYCDNPPSFTDAGNPDDSLESSCAGLVGNVKGTLLAKKTVMLGGHPGREIRFDLPLPDSTTKGLGAARLYLVGNRLYQLLVVAPSSMTFDGAAAQRFFDSFQLQGEATAVASTPAPAEPAPTPTPAPPAEPAAPAPADSPTFGGSLGQALAGSEPIDWGKPEDPDGDSKFTTDDRAATIEVPGGMIHGLDTPPGKANAPRLLKPVEGDFVAEVKVVGDATPADPPAPGSNVPFHGAGLLLWGGPENFIRLERAAFVRGGQLRTYVLFEHHQQNMPMRGQDANYPGGPVFLRMERHGTQVSGSFSLDGTSWQPLIPKEFRSTTASLGVDAVNTTSAPFRAQFEGLKLGKP